MKAIVLGCGLIGGVIAKDIAAGKDFQVTAADISKETVRKLADEAGVEGVVADLSDSAVIKKLVADQDIVLGATPGFLGFNVLRSVIEAGKNMVDICFMPEDATTLDELAKKNSVTAVVDMGAGPGITNMVVAHADSLLDETERVVMLLGAVPVIRKWPYEYKAAWSPLDVIEEYTRPVRLVENGKVVVKPALSDLELVDIPEIGTVEAFNTDGLRSIVDNIKASFMVEKTFRWPGHAEKMRMLRETGFFSDKPIEVGGVKVKPIDVTAKLLFPMWKLEDGEREFMYIRVVVEGKKGQKRLRYTYDHLIYTDEKTHTTGVARGTAFPCTTMARLVARGEYSRKGVCLPEYIGQKPETYRRVMKELERKGIIYKETVEEL